MAADSYTSPAFSAIYRVTHNLCHSLQPENCGSCVPQLKERAPKEYTIPQISRSLTLLECSCVLGALS